MPVSNETSLLTYQNFDGSNTTMLLHSASAKPANNVTLTAGFGVSTNFRGTNSVILEGKAKYELSDHFSTQTRLRNSFAPGNSSTQGRMSLEYKTNLSDRVSIYADPYVAGKYKYNSNELKPDWGAFVGGTYTFPSQNQTTKNKLSVEFQKYNGFKGGAENLGVNVIFSHVF